MPLSRDRDTAYRQLFDAFVRDNNLEIEIDEWPAEYESLWQGVLVQFNLKYPA